VGMVRGGGRRCDARQVGDGIIMSLEAVQHQAHLRIIDQQLATAPTRHEPRLLAVRRYEADQGSDSKASRCSSPHPSSHTLRPPLESLISSQSRQSQGVPIATADYRSHDSR
jgi:hypothetical protein